jgi:class 3 adenylate cyclase/PAS domain-containing protein
MAEHPVDSPGDPLEELQRRTAMLDAVAYAATRMVAGTSWRTHVHDLLNRLGRATAVSRVSVFEMHTDDAGAPVQSCRFDWREDGALDSLASDPRYSNMPLADEGLGGWAARRRRGEVVQALKRDLSGYLLKVFEEHGTLSFISVPIMVEGRWWGFLGFDECRTERVWNAAEIDVLKTAAALIAAAVERERANERLRISEERYALAARGTNDGLFDWDLERETAYFSPRFHEVLHADEGTFGASMDAFMAALEAGDRRRLEALLTGSFASGAEKFESDARLALPGAAGRTIVVRGLILYRGGEAARVVGSIRDITERVESARRLNEAERTRARLARYFSHNMVEELLATGGRLTESRTQPVGVLFADIWGFSRFSAGIPGDELVALLRDYLGLAEAAVFEHHGTLDKFLGDGLMATFGTPRVSDRDATNALTCAMAMAESVRRWNVQRIAAGHEPLRLGIGLHYGEAVLGDIGSERRMEFAVLGDTVNTASRIQEMTRDLDVAVLASDEIVQAARRESGFPKGLFRRLGRFRLRGRDAQVKLWGRAAEVPSLPEPSG